MYDKFHAYLCELETGFIKLAALLHEKLAALEKFDIDRLDAIIKEEQVFVLLSKSFDGNVQGYREKLSLKGEKLSDIVRELPESETRRFSEAFERLTAALDEVKALNIKCQDLIEERLYSLDRAIKEMDRSAGATYGKGGGSETKTGDAPKIFTKSV